VRPSTDGIEKKLPDFREENLPMDILKQTDLKQLMETTGEWCLSLFMPTHRFGREQQQDPVRFKNLIARAQEKLLEYGLRRPEVQELLRPAESLLANGDFWQHQSDGLAVFLSPEISQTYRLPSGFDELLVIGNNFHIKPLLPLLSKDGLFYILAISMNEIRLLLGTKSSIDEIEFEGIPTNMQEALWMNDPEKHKGFHTSASSPGRSGMRRATFHGHGGKAAADKINLLRYFQRVDNGMNDFLEEKHIPMVLAGVDYLLPIYHEANSYAGLLEEGLEGNPEDVSENELHKLAWELVEPIFKEDQKKAIRKFEQLHGQKNELVSTDWRSIFRAAHFGRVDTLFVSPGLQLWGRFDASKDTLEQHQESHPGDRDLFDLAAVNTLLNGGTVYALDPDKMPEKAQLAAIYRYATEG
jgi:hypothetical protein